MLTHPYSVHRWTLSPHAFCFQNGRSIYRANHRSHSAARMVWANFVKARCSYIQFARYGYLERCFQGYHRSTINRGVSVHILSQRRQIDLSLLDTGIPSFFLLFLLLLDGSAWLFFYSLTLQEEISAQSPDRLLVLGKSLDVQKILTMVSKCATTTYIIEGVLPEINNTVPS